MEAELTKAIEYAQKLINAATEVVGGSEIEVDQNWAQAPKVVGLAILCRSITNFRASLILAQQEQALEARALVRLLYENLLWVGALREQGSQFVEDMRNDEAHNRKKLAELTLKLTERHGGDVSGPDALKLGHIIKNLQERFPKPMALNASKVAGDGVVETAYIQYRRFSLDGVHCSVTALGRHLSHENVNGTIECFVNVIPRTSPAEALTTILHACRALMGVAVGVNEILGCTEVSATLAALMTEFEANGWQQTV